MTVPKKCSADRTPVKDRAPVEDSVYSLWLDEDQSEGKGFRRSIAAAVLIHAALLMITFPRIMSEPLVPDDPDKVFVIEQTPRFQPPVIPPTEIPKIKPTLVPIPDPTPEGPEPVVEDLPEMEVDLADIDADMVFTVPEAPPAPPEPDVHVVGGKIAAPERVHYVQPKYTELARKARVEGVVILQTTIDRVGNVVDIHVLKSLPMGLTEEAQSAVTQWRFEPSTLNGRPVAVQYNLTIHFRLQ